MEDDAHVPLRRRVEKPGGAVRNLTRPPRSALGRSYEAGRWSAFYFGVWAVPHMTAWPALPDTGARRPKERKCAIASAAASSAAPPPTAPPCSATWPPH